MEQLLIDGDVIAYRCGFAGEKTRYDVYHAADVETKEIEIDFGREFVFDIGKDAEPVETFENAKLCKAWLQVQGAEKAEHYIRVPRKEIDDVSHCIHSVKRVLGSIYDRFDGTPLHIYFSCSTANNWRTQCYPEYKANRKDRKPFWYAEIKEYMLKHYGCTEGVSHEADDLISMVAWAYVRQNKDVCIISIDKDFLQIPCFHYDWTKEELVDQRADAAKRALAVQRIMGDGVDNIKGVPGVGRVKAEAHLFNSVAPDLEAMVLEAYEIHFGKTPEARWQESLTTALVTLPEDRHHVNDLMEDVAYARETYETSKTLDGAYSDGSGTTAGEQEDATPSDRTAL